MLLFQKILYTDKFLIRYKEVYIKITNQLKISYMEEISIKGDAKKMKALKHQKLLLLHIIVNFCLIL